MLTAIVLSALAAGVLSLVLCGIVRGIALRERAMIAPRPDRWNSIATPTMGGVGFALAALIITVAAQLVTGTLPTRPYEVAVPAAAFAMLVIGILDDRIQLSPLAKLVSSLIVGALTVFVIGTSQPGALPWPATLAAVIWFGGVVHALNLLDNMDGLAAGIAMCAAALLAYFFAPVLGDAVVIYLAALTGSLIGFFYWNRRPARLFMGDAGSLFIGATLAAASLVPLTAAKGDVYQAAAIIGLVLVVPLFDTTFVLVLRRLAGRKATRGGTDHVSHRLVSLGFSERNAVRILYLVGLSAGMVAFMIRREGLQPMMPLAAMFGVGLVLVGVYLARAPAYDTDDFRALRKSSFAPLLKDLTFRWHAAEVLLDLVLITTCYYAAYRIRFEGEALSNFLPYFAASLPVVLGCKVSALYLSGLYERSWDTFGLVDLFALVRGIVSGSVLSVLAAAYIYRLEGFSRAVFMIDAVLLLVAVAATRASFRAMADAVHVQRREARRVVVYGAGAGGQILVREMRANAQWNMRPVGFLDDDALKVNRLVLGVRVRGTFEDLERVIKTQRVQEIILSSDAIDAGRETAIRAAASTAGIPVRRLRLEIR